MYLFLVDLKVAAGNRKEFSQTMDAIVNQIRSQTECVKATLCQDIEDETSFILLTEWTARKDLENYIRSDRFGVLLGAGCLLEHPSISTRGRHGSGSGHAALDDGDWMAMTASFWP